MSIHDLWPFLILMVVATAGARLAPLLRQGWRLPASIAVLLVFLCVAPFVLEPPFRTLQLTSIGIWAIAAMGLNIVTGYNGQISLGHGALVAVGAYTAAILTDSAEQMSFVDASPWPFWLAIIMAGVVTAVVGLFLGIPALRLSGPYLAIATLALAISFAPVMRKYDGFTGGTRGLVVNQPSSPPFFGDALDRDQWLYFLALFILILMLLLAWSILRGPLGRAFIAVRDSEVAAQAVGINIARTKLAAFSISAFYAGIAGGLYMQVFGLISPDAISIFQSINLFAVIVIGGLASILGSVIAGAALILVPAEAPNLVGKLPGLDVDIVKQAPGAIQGALLIITVLSLPAGAAGLWHQIERFRPQDIGTAVRAAPDRARARFDSARAQLASALGRRDGTSGDHR